MRAFTSGTFIIILTTLLSCSTRPLSIDNKKQLDRFQGAILGTYMGDSIGKGVEYVYRKKPNKAPKEYREKNVVHFAERKDTRYKGKFGYHPSGTYTDDTEEMIALLDALIKEDGQVVQETIISSLSEHFRFNHGYSSKTSKLLTSIQNLTNKKDWKKIVLTPERLKYESNGCAMRSAPMALIASNVDDQTLRALTNKQCQVTHPSFESSEGAVIIVKAIQLALNTPKGKFNKQHFMNSLIDFCKYDRLKLRLEQVRNLLNKDLSSQEELALLRDSKKIGVGFKIIDSVPGAIYFAVKHIHSIQKGLNASVHASITGDSDTIPAMAGAIIGAYVGRSSFPKKWVSQLYDDTPRWMKHVNASSNIHDLDYISWKKVMKMTEQLYNSLK